MNRTDGALVRLTTYVPPDEDIEVAEKRIQSFARLAVEELHDYIPH